MNSYPSRPSLLMSIAGRLPLLAEQAEELDSMLHRVRAAQNEGRIEDDMCRRVERWAESASAALEAAEKLIASEPARALAEAAIQLMLAVSKAQVVAIEDLTIEERAAAASDLERLLQSALPIVADAAGIDLAEFGRAYYADRRTDPFYRGTPSSAPSDSSQTQGPAQEALVRLKAAGFGS